MLVRKRFAGQGIERLASRKRRAKKRLAILIGAFAIALLGALLWLLWQPYMRISHVEVYGADESFVHYATDAMRGSYAGLVPRDSALFFSRSNIRAALLAEHREIAAVSIFREGFSGITLRVIPRIAAARWCGLAPTLGVEAYCYLFDSSGYIYAAASTSDSALNPYAVYDAPRGSLEADPLGARLTNAAAIPEAMSFAREVGNVNARVASIVFRNDEVDILLESGTRLTYVRGHEHEAYAAFASAAANVNLADGSVDYIDLRFPDKVYVKKNGAKVGE